MPQINPISLQSLYIEMLFKDTKLSSGSAFVGKVGSRYFLVTARHNFTGLDHYTGECLCKMAGIPDAVRFYHHPDNNPDVITSTVKHLFEGGRPAWKEHQRSTDVATLEIPPVSDINIFGKDTNLGNPIAVENGDVVSVVGFPFGIKNACNNTYFAIWSTGFIATDRSVDYEGEPVFLIDCRSRPGQSGSPVLCYRSGGLINLERGSVAQSPWAVRFLGVYSGRINPESDLGRVWKSSVVDEIIRAAL